MIAELMNKCEWRAMPYGRSVVTRYVKKSNKEYSIFFGDYEFVFIVGTSEDITNFGPIFGVDCKDWSKPNVNTILKRNGHILKKGKYQYSETHTYDDALILHIYIGFEDEYDIYIIPEGNETLPNIFNKIFHLKN